MGGNSIGSATIKIGQLQAQRDIRIISAVGHELSSLLGDLINKMEFRSAFLSLYAGFINTNALPQVKLFGFTLFIQIKSCNHNSTVELLISKPYWQVHVSSTLNFVGDLCDIRYKAEQLFVDRTYSSNDTEIPDNAMPFKFVLQVCPG